MPCPVARGTFDPVRALAISALPLLRLRAYAAAVATVSRPRSGRESLQYFAELQRQVGERVAPLRTRQRLRRRARIRRLVGRAVLLMVPVLVAVLLALDAGGSRTWLGDRWQDVTRSATTPDQQSSAAASPGS
ncbi:MAG: hypothetical protein ABI807_02545 [Sporichthyaceae bacterium]